MKLFFLSISLFLFLVNVVFAHGGEEDIKEVTSIVDSEWMGPVIAVLVITISVFVAKNIKKS